LRLCVVASLLVTSAGFRVRIEGLDPHTESLPIRNSCEGENVNPAIVWENPPNRSRSFAITMVDDDSIPIREFLHWSVVNIPRTARYLLQNQTVSWKDPVKFGRNGNMYAGYTGPCNAASQHKYTLKLYPLNVGSVPLRDDFTQDEFVKALRTHVIGQPAQTRFYFTGAAISPTALPCDHPKQELHGPPHSPDRPLPPIVYHQSQEEAEMIEGRRKPPRPDPAVVEAANNDPTQVGGGISSTNPSEMRNAAQFFRKQLHAKH